MSGVRSEGLRMYVFPAPMATGIVHRGIIQGKLNGVIAATTPSGNLYETLSMPRATSRTLSPIRRVGIPQANSTTSMPRLTSPPASLASLPFSKVTRSRSSPKCSSRSIL